MLSLATFTAMYLNFDINFMFTFFPYIFHQIITLACFYRLFIARWSWLGCVNVRGSNSLCSKGLQLKAFLELECMHGEI